MGKIMQTILEIQRKEHLTLPEVFEKYPHLAKLQLEEIEESKAVKENRELLLD